MKMTFRWYGSDDPVTLDNIRQIPCMTGVVTAVYSVPVGQVWPQEEIDKMKAEINAKGLEMEVIESVPVHEDIKLKRGNYQLYIDNYKENIRRLAKAGVKCICYNFMPVFDWTRSRLDQPLPDGSNALVYYKEDVDKMDPTKMTLPGWDASYSPEEMTGLIEEYKNILLKRLVLLPQNVMLTWQFIRMIHHGLFSVFRELLQQKKTLTDFYHSTMMFITDLHFAAEVLDVLNSTTILQW